MSSDNIADVLRKHVADEEAREALLADLATTIGLAMRAGAEVLHAYESQDLDDDIPLEGQTFSIGWTCEKLQLTPAALRHFMRLAGVRFAGSHNDLPFLNLVDMTKVARQVNQSRREAAEIVKGS